MSTYKYKDIVSRANTIKNNVKENYELGLTNKWCYYICKAIISPKTTEFKGVKIADAKKVKGTAISRQIYKTSYMDIAERIVRYVEHENQLPATVKFTTKAGKVYNINIDVATDMFARILVYYDANNAYPKYANINNKCFIKPIETGNAVLNYFIKKTGIKPTCIDDFCEWCKNKVDYEFYYDDHKSNKEVIDEEAGNCTDLAQAAINVGKGLGYDTKSIHVMCNKSGVGHIYPMFRKNGVNGGDWFIRDVACIADESRYCVWCESGNGGSQLEVNPSWFLQNLNR